MSVPEIVDRSLIAQFRRRALARALGGEDFLLTHAAADLAERLSAVDRTFEKATVILPVSVNLDALAACGKLNQLTMLDMSAMAGETLPLEPQSHDLILSLLTLQDLNDVPGALIQMRHALKPDGLMLATFAGGDTLHELRFAMTLAEEELSGGASPRVMPFADVRAAGALLQRTGFALPVTDVETLTVRYESAFGLFRDLRGMGAQNALHARSRKAVGRRFFQRIAEIYADKFSDADGRVRASFSFISMSGWAPHDSQQKPMKPGSAKMSLAAALERQ